MKTHVCLLLLALAPLAGCRNKQINNQLVQRELRLQEDRIYELEDMLCEAETMIESSRYENDALKEELAGGDPGPGATGSTRSTTPRSTQPRSTQPRRPLGGGARTPAPEVDNPTLDVPEIDLGTPEEGSSIDMGPGIPGPEESGSTGEDGTGAVEFLPDEATPLSDARVSKLIVNKRLTGGIDRDGHPGDDGLMVVCEPRDEQGELVKAPADVSLVLIDPSKSGAAARVARWDFKGDETPLHFHKSPLGTGLHFDLPWPSSPPSAENLKLFVRYTGPHGDKVVSEMPVSVDPLGNKRLAKRKAPPKQAAVRPGWAAPRTVAAARSRAPHSRVPIGRPATGPLAEADSLAENSTIGSSNSLRDKARSTATAANQRHDRDSWHPNRNSDSGAPSSDEDERDDPELAANHRSANSRSSSRDDRDRESDRHDRESSTASRPTWKPYR